MGTAREPSSFKCCFLWCRQGDEHCLSKSYVSLFVDLTGPVDGRDVLLHRTCFLAFEHMVVSQIGGPQCRPQNTITLVMGIPTKVPLILVNPYIPYLMFWGPSAYADLHQQYPTPSEAGVYGGLLHHHEHPPADLPQLSDLFTSGWHLHAVPRLKA